MKAAKLKELQKAKKVVIIDVREPAEIEKFGSVKGAKHIPMGQMFLHAAKGKLPKDKKIVTVCRSGKRCQIVAKELKKDGYDMDYLEGGAIQLEEPMVSTSQTEVKIKKARKVKRAVPKKKQTRKSAKPKALKKKAKLPKKKK